VAYLGAYLTWSGGVPVDDMPPPSDQTFRYACMYNDGSEERVAVPSSCPQKLGLDLLEVDDLFQVGSNSFPPAITINIPIATPPIMPTDVPSLPTLPPPILPVSFPSIPPAVAPVDDGSNLRWLLMAAGLLLVGTGVGVQRRRRVSR
jgi:hypothetical protein